MAEATHGDRFPEAYGGYEAQFRVATARLDGSYRLVGWATTDELRSRGESALRSHGKPRSATLAIDSASAGAVLAEQFDKAQQLEAAGYRVVGCDSGIGILDMRNRLLAWIDPIEMPPPMHACPHCKCSHSPADATKAPRR